MTTTLLIMAAGIGSRFGGGIKQLAKIDSYGHIIMDYSVHDAILAGFNKIVFVIRRDIEADFREVIGERMEALCKEKGVQVFYAFQDVHNIPGVLPEGRTKPWGTGHAVLCAAGYLTDPFAVINADDYYGKAGLKLVHDHLIKEKTACMAGFRLKNTLSENGGVTRGICRMKNGYLTDVAETKNIVKIGNNAIADGIAIPSDSLVSMNMWGFQPEFTDTLREGFVRFLSEEMPKDPQKSEYLIPVFVGGLVQSKLLSVKVLETDDTWYGMTYKEDVEPVRHAFAELIAKGIYDPKTF